MARKRITRYTRRSDFVFSGDGDGGFPARKYLLGYAKNLLEEYQVNEDFLSFVLFVIDRDSRKTIIDFVCKNQQANGEDSTGMKMTGREPDLYEDLDDSIDLARGICRVLFGNGFGGDKKQFYRLLRDVVSRCLETADGMDDTGHRQRLARLARLFYLEQHDVGLLVFLYCMYELNVTNLARVADDMTYTDFQRFASVATGVPPAQTKAILGLRGRLNQCGLIESINTRRNDFYALENFVVEYLSGIADTGLVDRYVKHDSGSVLPLDSYTVDASAREIILSVLASPGPCNILLYGAAGTGKTQFARSLVREAGLDASFLQFGNRGRRDRGGISVSAGERAAALNVGTGSVDPERGVLIVDEADFILNTRFMFMSVESGAEKGWLNDFLDNSAAKIIWISNETGSMEESTLRRFSYSYHFEGFSLPDRVSVLKNRLEGHPLARFIDDDLVYRLSAEFQVNAGGIASALDSAARIYRGKRPAKKNVTATLRDILSRHEKLVCPGAGQKKSMLAEVTDYYHAGALNTDIDTGTMMDSAAMFMESLEAAPQEERINMNMLFWGLPGTGKTEFAKYMAGTLKKRLLVKRYSDLESMWLGETEKNICAVFAEAEKSGAILFVDEADSFFTSRENAFRSWEVSRTNEFLTQMENHRGMFICCTNLLPSMDRAAMRRFTWKVEFRPLTPEQRAPLYARYFKRGGHRLTPAMNERLRRMEGLTPGDIRAAWNRYRFLKGEAFDHWRIIEQLEKEVRYRDGSGTGGIGFHAG